MGNEPDSVFFRQQGRDLIVPSCVCGYLRYGCAGRVVSRDGDVGEPDASRVFDGAADRSRHRDMATEAADLTSARVVTSQEELAGRRPKQRCPAGLFGEH